MKVIAPGLRPQLVKTGLEQAKKTDWRYEDDIHEEALEKFTDNRLVEMLS